MTELHQLPYERIHEESLLRAIRRESNEQLLVLQPFGWHLDGSHLPNQAEHFERESVCADLGLKVVCDFGPYIAIVTADEAPR